MNRPVTLYEENFRAELVAAFPGFATDIRSLATQWSKDEPTLRAVISDVLKQDVERAIDVGDRDRLVALCQFIERMAVSPDVRARCAQ